MPKLDRYLFREFAQSFLATLIVLLVVSLGGVVVDLLGSIADGKLPPSLMISQLGLQLLNYFALILPLALMLGLLLAFSRLYRDSEMPVLNSIGIVTYLNPFIGHHEGDIVGKICAQTGKNVREVVLERGLLTAEQLDEILSIENLMNPQYKAKRYTREATV